MRAWGPLSALRLEDVLGIAGLSDVELEELVSDPERHYRRRPKKIGGKIRPLDVPMGRMRLVQDRLLSGVFRNIPPHGRSSCVKRRGNLWAARRHAGRLFLLHLDIADFFPSITLDRVHSRMTGAGASTDVAWVLSRLTCLPDRLPQGAPTSVAVSDLVLYPLDNRLSGLARSIGCQYTRYVDDLALSGGAAVVRAESRVRSIIADEGWRVNEEKGGIRGPRDAHPLLGFCVRGSIPRKRRTYLQYLRDDLRKVAAGIESASAERIESLRGRVGHAVKLNPWAAARLNRLLSAAVQRSAGVRTTAATTFG